MYVFLFFDVPIARQAVGILYLTFVPGYVFSKLLKLDNLEAIETILFSVGFSVAFLMLSGLVIDQFGPLVGIDFPLSVLPLSLFINTLVIIGAVAAHFRQGKKYTATFHTISFHPAMLLLALIPALGVIGAYMVNATGNNFILIVTLLAIAGVFSVSAFFERSTKFYAFAIFMIALALLLQVSIVSNYILPYGGDSTAEMYVFKNVQQSAVWNPMFPISTDQTFGRFNAMLSITILPTVYSNMLAMDPTWVFKIVYPLIFAFVPIALYMLWQPYIGKKFAFLAAFLFMAQSTFYTEMTALNRQMIGELFFVLLLIVLLNKKLKPEIKFFSFALFGFGLIFSHYALSEIFLFLVLAAWAVSFFYLKRPSFNLQLGMVLLFFVAMFAWYIYTSGAVVFDSFMTFTSYVTAQLGDFFNPAARGQAVLTGLGLTESPSMLNTISRGFAYLTEIFIVVGIVAFVAKKTRVRFDRDFTIFSLITVAILVSLTVVPGLANTLNMTRFYHILLMMLAPFCILGIWAFAKFVLKNERKIVVALLVVAVLVPYFLFQTSLVYEVAQTDSWSVPLSEYRMNPLRLYGDLGYIDSFSVRGAEWVSANIPYRYTLYADNSLYTALTAYGVIYRGYVTALSNATIVSPGQFIYLSYISLNYDVSMQNGSMDGVFAGTDVVYSNGGSNILYQPEYR